MRDGEDGYGEEIMVELFDTRDQVFDHNEEADEVSSNRSILPSCLMTQEMEPYHMSAARINDVTPLEIMRGCEEQYWKVNLETTLRWVFDGGGVIRDTEAN